MWVEVPGIGRYELIIEESDDPIVAIQWAEGVRLLAEIYRGIQERRAADKSQVAKEQARPAMLPPR